MIKMGRAVNTFSDTSHVDGAILTPAKFQINYICRRLHLAQPRLDCTSRCSRKRARALLLLVEEVSDGN